MTATSKFSRIPLVLAGTGTHNAVSLASFGSRLAPKPLFLVFLRGSCPATVLDFLGSRRVNSIVR